MFLSTEIDNPITTRVWLRPRDGPDPIKNLCLSISDNIFCKIEPVSFWVQLNSIPNCVIDENLYWPYVIQYTTKNHTSGCIAVLIIPPKPDIIGKLKEPRRCILSYLIPSEWMWHFVYPIWPCTSLSIMFQGEYLEG